MTHGQKDSESAKPSEGLKWKENIMSRDESEDQLEAEVVERLEREMAPIEEALHRRLTEKAEEDVVSDLARLRADLEARGVDGDDLENKLRDEELDRRAEKVQEVENELGLHLDAERTLRRALIQKDVLAELGHA
jgi:hypothetical protein